MRLIDADAASLSTYNEPYWTESEAASVRSFLLHQPTIDPETIRPTGRWVDHLVRDWRCSECGEKIHKVRTVDGYCYDDKPNYCPNCGAKMEG